MIIELIYIGDHFYRESGSAMSSIYTVEGHRSDWGFVQRDLREGHTINIRPATRLELNHYEAMLNQMRRKADTMREKTE